MVKIGIYHDDTNSVNAIRWTCALWLRICWPRCTTNISNMCIYTASSYTHTHTQSGIFSGCRLHVRPAAVSAARKFSHKCPQTIIIQRTILPAPSNRDELCVCFCVLCMCVFPVNRTQTEPEKWNIPLWPCHCTTLLELLRLWIMLGQEVNMLHEQITSRMCRICAVWLDWRWLHMVRSQCQPREHKHYLLGHYGYTHNWPVQLASPSHSRRQTLGMGQRSQYVATGIAYWSSTAQLSSATTTRL